MTATESCTDVTTPGLCERGLNLHMYSNLALSTHSARTTPGIHPSAAAPFHPLLLPASACLLLLTANCCNASRADSMSVMKEKYSNAHSDNHQLLTSNLHSPGSPEVRATRHACVMICWIVSNR